MNGWGGFLHFASTLFSAGFCQLCWLLPRGNEDDGLCAETTTAAQATTTVRVTCHLTYLIPFDFTSQFEFVHRLQSLPVNILPAFLSPLKVHSSQFDATLANSPPPG